jgi:hypothetical protein
MQRAQDTGCTVVPGAPVEMPPCERATLFTQESLFSAARRWMDEKVETNIHSPKDEKLMWQSSETLMP